MLRLRSFQSWQSTVSPNLLAPQGRFLCDGPGILELPGLQQFPRQGSQLCALQQGYKHGAPLSTGPQMGPKGLIEAESDSLKVIFLHSRFIS